MEQATEQLLKEREVITRYLERLNIKKQYLECLIEQYNQNPSKEIIKKILDIKL